MCWEIGDEARCQTVSGSKYRGMAASHHSERTHPDSHCSSTLGCQGCTVLLRSDNMAMVDILNCGTNWNSKAMQLMRLLAVIQARWHLCVTAEHIPGVHNTLADAMSRNKLVTFHFLFPQVNKQPTHILEALVDLLIISRPDCTSTQWSTLWNNIFLLV